MNDDFDFLPAPLPTGERILWQGRPEWRSLARRGFHLPKLASYLGVLLAWYAATSFLTDAVFTDALLATLRMTCVALTPLVLVCLYAWMTARGTVYMITDRRLILRVGIAMPITFNIPFAKIKSAGLKTWSDGSGNIALSLLPTERIAYFVLWPHVHPWRMARTEPMLRSIPDAARVARSLSRGLAASADMPVSDISAATKSSTKRPHAPALA